MNRAQTEFNLWYALHALRRRLPLFLVAVLIIPAAAVAVSFLQKREYTATASLLFRDPQFDQMIFGASFTPSETDPTRQAATNLTLVSLPRVAALTAAALHMTQKQVTSSVSVGSVNQSDVASVQATAPSAADAAMLANTYATKYITSRRNSDRLTIRSAELPLQHQIASLPRSVRYGSLGQSLQSRLGQLGVLASLQTGNAELVQPAEVPSGPSSPEAVRNGAFGLFFGLLLGIGLVLLAEALDRTLRSQDEVEQIFERPVLASLPESARLKDPDPALLELPEAEREAFRMLWTNLRYFTLSREVRSVLVTSGDRGDGKTTTAWGLGVAAANAGRRTLVMEADLRNPGFAARFRLPRRPGLTSALTGDASFDEAIVQVPLARGDDGSPGHSMDVLLAGPPPPDPADLLQSHRVADFLAWLKDRYDLIVIDTAPPTLVSDTVPLMTMVDGVVVVSRLAHTHRDRAHRLRQQLDHLQARLLGIVLNAAQEAQPYGYGFSNAYQPTPAPAPDRINGTPNRSEAELEPVHHHGSWYADPFEVAAERWWDGGRWTEEVRGTATPRPNETGRAGDNPAPVVPRH